LPSPVSATAAAAARLTTIVQIVNKESGRHEGAGRHYGLSLTPTSIASAFQRYFSLASRGIVSQILDELRRLLTFFETTNKWSFFCSSLLLVYDAQPAEGRRACRVAMIDFGHVYALADPSQRDEDYLVGLRNVLRLVQEQLAGRA
jgi:hypothetical protein